MKRQIQSVIAVSITASLVVGLLPIRAEDKPKYTVKEVMKACHSVHKPD